MSRLLGLARSFFRWLFVMEAAILLIASAQNLFTPPRDAGLLDASSDLSRYAFYAFILAIAVVLAAGWGTTRKPNGKRSPFAIAGCVINAGIAGLLLRYVRPFTYDFVTFAILQFAASIGGIALFSMRNTAPATQALPKQPPIPGDRTSRATDLLFNVAALVATAQLVDRGYRWAGERGLPDASLVPALVCIALAGLVTILVHECGHALAATAVHMKLVGFLAGPLRWRLRDGRGQFSFDRNALRGAVSVAPTNPDQPDWQTAVMILGGPLANLCTAPLFFFALLHTRGSPFPQTWLPLNFLSSFALVCGIFNLLPMRISGGRYSDGARLLQIFTHSSVIEHWKAQLRIQSTLVTPLRFRDIDPRPLEQAVCLYPRHLAGLSLTLAVAQIFEDSGRIPEASAAIAKAAAIYHSSIKLPAPLHTIFAFHYACYQRDPAATRLWWDRMQSTKIEAKDVDYWLANSALLWIEGQIPEAEAAWQNAEAKARKLPPFGAYEFDRERVALLRTLLDEQTLQPEKPSPSESLSAQL